jgi:hypothetical protein
LGFSWRAGGDIDGIIPACLIIRHLADIPIAVDLVTLEAVIQFGDVGFGHLVEGESQLGGDLGQVPEHVAEFSLEGLAGVGGDLAAFVTKDFLDLASHFPGFVDQAEGGVDDGVPDGRVSGGLTGFLLVFVKVHDYLEGRAGSVQGLVVFWDAPVSLMQEHCFGQMNR